MKTLRFGCLLLALIASAAAGCSRPATEPTGPDSPEQLAEQYLQAVSNDDAEALKSLLLTGDDFKRFAKRMNKQGADMYQQFVVRDFQTRNRDYTGKPLKFIAFRLGQEVMSKEKYALYRGSTIIAELPGGEKITLELNFVSKIGSKWKIFSLRYMKDMKGGPGAPGIPDVLPGAKFGPEQKNKVKLKIKKVEDGEAPGEEAPASPDVPPAGEPAAEAPAPAPAAP